MAAARGSGSWAGVGLVALGLLGLILSRMALMQTPEAVAFLLVAVGLGLAVLGPGAMRPAWLPLAFLLVTLPVPTTAYYLLSTELQLVSSAIGTFFTSPGQRPSEDQTFVLGAFTHFNEAIVAGTAITQATLSVTANLKLNGSSLGAKAFDFVFHHDETPNSGLACCDDLIRVGNLKSSDTFLIGGTLYTLAIAGFLVGGKLVGTLASAEGLASTAQLVTRFTVTPVPGAAFLLAPALPGLGAWQRRARRRPLAPSACSAEVLCEGSWGGI
jgi:hypothetical protein